MARPVKIGIDYFSLDVDFDTSLEIVLAEYGEKGLGIVVRIWQHLYKSNYFIPYNKDELLMIKRKCSDTSVDEIKDVIERMIEKNLFSKELFEEFQVLTSPRIQSNYLEAKTKSNHFAIYPELILVNTEKIHVNSYLAPEQLPQRKLKEKKLKETKLNKSKKEEVSKDTMSVDSDSPIITSPKLDYSDIANYFNLHSGLKEITSMTPKRKSNINARVKVHGIDKIYLAIDNTRLSPFMHGDNNRTWVATFDWIFGHPNNFVKVVEGNYVKEDAIPNNNLKSRADALKDRFGDQS